MENQLANWVGFSQLAREDKDHFYQWTTRQVNRLLVKILHKKELTLGEFFDLEERKWKREFDLPPLAIKDLREIKNSLANYAFQVENLLDQGYELLPLNSPLYSETLKENLQFEAPPLLYSRGNTNLLQKESWALRIFDEEKESRDFGKNIALRGAKNNVVLITGSEGQEHQPLIGARKEGAEIITVLNQGITTWERGFEYYYREIVDGQVLVVSALPPEREKREDWEGRVEINTLICGLAQKVFMGGVKREEEVEFVTRTLRRSRKVHLLAPVGKKKIFRTLLDQGAIFFGSEGEELPEGALFEWLEDEVEGEKGEGESPGEVVHREASGEKRKEPEKEAKESEEDQPEKEVERKEKKDSTRESKVEKDKGAVESAEPEGPKEKSGKKSISTKRGETSKGKRQLGFDFDPFHMEGEKAEDSAYESPLISPSELVNSRDDLHFGRHIDWSKRPGKKKEPLVDKEEGSGTKKREALDSGSAKPSEKSKDNRPGSGEEDEYTEREKLLLEHFEEKGTLKTKEAAEILEVSSSTARKVIRALISQGELEKKGAGRKTRYVKSD